MTPDTSKPRFKGHWDWVDSLLGNILRQHKQEATTMNRPRCPVSRLEPNAAKPALKTQVNIGKSLLLVGS